MRSSRAAVSAGDAKSTAPPSRPARARRPRRSPPAPPRRCPRRRTGRRAGRPAAAPRTGARTAGRGRRSSGTSRSRGSRRRAVQLELGQVGGEHLDARPEPLARLRHHRRRAVDRDDLAARQPLEQRGRHAAGAAAGVEHALVAAQLEAVEHLAPHRLQRRRDRAGRTRRSSRAASTAGRLRRRTRDRLDVRAAERVARTRACRRGRCGRCAATAPRRGRRRRATGPRSPLVPASASVWQLPQLSREDRLAVARPRPAPRPRRSSTRTAPRRRPSVRGCVSSFGDDLRSDEQHHHEGGGQRAS